MASTYWKLYDLAIIISIVGFFFAILCAIAVKHVLLFAGYRIRQAEYIEKRINELLKQYCGKKYTELTTFTRQNNIFVKGQRVQITDIEIEGTKWYSNTRRRHFLISKWPFQGDAPLVYAMVPVWLILFILTLWIRESYLHKEEISLLIFNTIRIPITIFIVFIVIITIYILLEWKKFIREHYA